jgi:hypothetical protein
MMVMPHTSAMILSGYFTRGITGLEMNFVGKKELFVFLCWYFKYMGGEPLDRSGGMKVDVIAEIFSEEKFFVCSSSRGTRKKVS